MEMELLALIAELTSVAASNQQLKKPIKIPRPKHLKRSGVRTAETVDGARQVQDPYKKAAAVMAATTRGAVHRS